MRQPGSEMTGKEKELSCLQVDNPVVGVEAGLAASLFQCLHNLARADFAGRFGYVAADDGRGKLSRDAHGLGEEGIAEQDRGVRAELLSGR